MIGTNRIITELLPDLPSKAADTPAAGKTAIDFPAMLASEETLKSSEPSLPMRQKEPNLWSEAPQSVTDTADGGAGPGLAGFLSMAGMTTLPARIATEEAMVADACCFGGATERSGKRVENGVDLNMAGLLSTEVLPTSEIQPRGQLAVQTISEKQMMSVPVLTPVGDPEAGMAVATGSGQQQPLPAPIDSGSALAGGVSIMNSVGVASEPSQPLLAAKVGVSVISPRSLGTGVARPSGLPMFGAVGPEPLSTGSGEEVAATSREAVAKLSAPVTAGEAAILSAAGRNEAGATLAQPGQDHQQAASGLELRLSGLFDRPSRSIHDLPDAVSRQFPVSLTGAGVVAADGLRPPFVGTTPFFPQPPPRLDSQIVDLIVSRVTFSRSSGESSLTLTLHPKELGTVRIELLADQEGLRVHLHSQNQLAQDILEKHLPRLREGFDSQGLKIQDLQVSCDARHDGGEGGLQQEQRQTPRFHSHAESSDPTSETAQEDEAVEPTPFVTGRSTMQGFSLHI